MGRSTRQKQGREHEHSGVKTEKRSLPWIPQSLCEMQQAKLDTQRTPLKIYIFFKEEKLYSLHFFYRVKVYKQARVLDKQKNKEHTKRNTYIHIYVYTKNTQKNIAFQQPTPQPTCFCKPRAFSYGAIYLTLTMEFP